MTAPNWGAAPMRDQDFTVKRIYEQQYTHRARNMGKQITGNIWRTSFDVGMTRS